MGKCPFCDEEWIQRGAAKCVYCGEWRGPAPPREGVDGPETPESRPEGREDLQKQAPVEVEAPPVSLPQPVPAASVPQADPGERAEARYKAFLGGASENYYLEKFHEFDRHPPGIKAGWNWAAFFFGGGWAIYRKMYGWFFFFVEMVLLAGILQRVGAPAVGIAVLSGSWIAFSIYANALYHAGVAKKIADAQRFIINEPMLLQSLRHEGGVNTGFLGGCGLALLVTIWVAVPRFIPHTERAAPVTAPAQETGQDGRFVAYSDGTVLDPITNLMWAARDNGSDINWQDAQGYCRNYRGGGFSDWRMPTHEELGQLYDSTRPQPAECYSLVVEGNTRYGEIYATPLVDLTCDQLWESETRRGLASAFAFRIKAAQSWDPQSNVKYYRVLPVRSVK